jgi:hypothetical protein
LLEWVVRIEFRIGLFFGIATAIALDLYCVWLWQTERQIARHTENLFRQVEVKNWNGVAEFIADDYHDQWNNDRALLLERMRLLLAYSRQTRIAASNVTCKIDNGVGIWRGKILIESDDAELTAAIKERLNSLTKPFELGWRHVSGKPWDWKLIRVSNPELEIPANFE